METQTEKTKMTNPPQSQTQMVAAEKTKKMYKLVALQPFNVGEVEWKEGQIVRDGTKTIFPGEIIEVDGRRARDLCKKIEGGYAFSGERYNADQDLPKHNLTRARLATAADLVEKAGPITPFDDENRFED